MAKAISDVVGQDAGLGDAPLPCLADGSAAEAKWHEIATFFPSIYQRGTCRARHVARGARGVRSLDTDRDGVVRRAEFCAVGAVNRVVPPERQIDGDSVWGLLDCNGDGELERTDEKEV